MHIHAILVQVKCMHWPFASQPEHMFLLFTFLVLLFLLPLLHLFLFSMMGLRLCCEILHVKKNVVDKKIVFCEKYVFDCWKENIVRPTTGAKGCYFLAGFLQVSHIFLKHILKFCIKSLISLLQVSKKLLTNILRSLFLVPYMTYHDSSL